MLGFLLIYEAISLWSYKDAFFSAIPPLGAQIDVRWVGLILVVMAMSGALLAIGWLGSLNAILGWTCMCILARCNPLPLTGADIMLMCLLLWHVILKAGESECRSGRRRGNWLFFFYVAFVCIVYWTSGAHKTSPAWKIDGSAMAMILRTPSLQTGFTAWLLGLGSGTLSFLSHLTLYLEQFGPALLIIGWRHVVLRHIVILAFMCFHLFGILPFLNIGHFPVVCFTLWLPLVSDEAWQILMTRTRWNSAGSIRSSTSFENQACFFGRFYLAFALALYLVTCETLAAFGVDPEKFTCLRRFTIVARYAQMYTQWAFFCPGPSPVDGWLLASWQDGEGHIINLNCVGEAFLEESQEVYKVLPYPDHRWRTLMSHVRQYPRSVIADNYYDWLWRRIPHGRHRELLEAYWCETATNQASGAVTKVKIATRSNAGP